MGWFTNITNFLNRCITNFLNAYKIENFDSFRKGIALSIVFYFIFFHHWEKPSLLEKYGLKEKKQYNNLNLYS